MILLWLDIYVFLNVYYYRFFRFWMNKWYIKFKKIEILFDNNFIFINVEYEVVENNVDY